MRDTGIGIPADRLPHIFDDFTQASYDIGMKYGGSGLGLAICKKLVELHGGQIAVAERAGAGIDVLVRDHARHGGLGRARGRGGGRLGARALSRG